MRMVCAIRVMGPHGQPSLTPRQWWIKLPPLGGVGVGWWESQIYISLQPLCAATLDCPNTDHAFVFATVTMCTNHAYDHVLARNLPYSLPSGPGPRWGWFAQLLPLTLHNYVI